MPKPKPSSNGLPGHLSGSPTPSPQKLRASPKGGPRPYRRPPTPAKNGNDSKEVKASKRQDRRALLLDSLGLTCEQVDSSVQVTPLFRRIKVTVERLIEVLSVDGELESACLVAMWNKLTPAQRVYVGLEGLALGCGMTPRRLWELYCGANMMQSRESIGAMICEALPDVMAKTVRQAKGGKIQAMEHIYKAARVLPTPKGSVINIGVPAQGQLEPGDDGPENEGRMLEGADDFLLRASRAMASRQLPIPAADVEEEDEDEDE